MALRNNKRNNNKISGLDILMRRLKEAKELNKKNRKIADWISPETIRRLPPPGVEEVWKGRTQKPLPYSEFKAKWKMREVPEFPISEDKIREMYQDYLWWFKRKGRPPSMFEHYFA